MKRILISAALAAGLMPGIAAADEAADAKGSPVSVTFSGGLQSTQFSRFNYGDMRTVFPVLGGAPTGEFYDERGRDLSQSFSGGVDYTMDAADGIFGFNTISATYTDSKASRQSAVVDSSATDEFYVPYIDATTRPTLTGGQAVGIFTNPSFMLNRQIHSRQFSLSSSSQQSVFNSGIRILPRVSFSYERLRQVDTLNTSSGTDPIIHSLDAKIVSNIFKFGAGLDASVPLFSSISLVGGVGGSLNISRNKYNGTQSFLGGPSFTTSFMQHAQAYDSETHMGGEMGGKAGFAIDLGHSLTLTSVGNVRWLSGMPAVMYPGLATGSGVVTGGPAHIVHDSALNFGFDMGLNLQF